ncbi:MAG: DUF928 domain-containing protein [Myxococcota bacterium]
MTEGEEAALRRLMQDVEESDWPAPELLARYATDPNRLSEAEKQTVERALAASRTVGDELATLRGFDFGALDADRHPARTAAGRLAPAGDGGGGEGAGGLAAWLNAWLARPPVWVGAAALLALALWLAASDESPLRSGVADSMPQLARRNEPPAPRGSAPGTAGTELPGPDGRAADEPMKSSEPTTAIVQAEPTRTPTPTPESTPESTPKDASRIAARDADAGPDMPTAGKRATPPEAKPELLLAMAMPDYHPAYGVDARESGEWIVRGATSEAPRVTVLAPDHVARACNAQPALHWSLDRLPATGTFFLTIVDERDEPVVLDRALAQPTRAGIQRVDLAGLGIRLPAARTLRWSIALRADEAAAPEAFDFGWLRVDPPDASAEQALAARSDADRSAAYAELGCYSEALDAALAIRARRPDEATPHRAVERLADQAGLDPKLLGE